MAFVTLSDFRPGRGLWVGRLPGSLIGALSGTLIGPVAAATGALRRRMATLPATRGLAVSGGALDRALQGMARRADRRQDYRALSRLSQVSDAQLAAQGADRLGEINRILGLAACY